MKTWEQISAELAATVSDKERELSELKRQHERLREVVDQSLSDLECADLKCWCFTRAAMRSAPECTCANCSVWRKLSAALDSPPATLSKQDLEQVPRPWLELELENENLKKNLAALEKNYNKLLEKMK